MLGLLVLMALRMWVVGLAGLGWWVSGSVMEEVGAIPHGGGRRPLPRA